MKYKKILLSLISSLSLLPVTGANPYTIEVETPPRPEGATDLIGFSVAPIDTVKVGFVGLGMRGSDAVERFVYVPGSKIADICDVDPARV